MPDVRNCRKCGRIFNYLSGAPICPTCKEADEVDFRKVKEFLYDNPGASMSEVSAALDIRVEKITSYLREGRLEIVNNDGNFILDCEICGKSIRTGRFCDACSRDLSSSMQSTASQLSQTLSNEKPLRKNIDIRYLNKD